MKRVLLGSIAHIHQTVCQMFSLSNVYLQSFLWSRGTISLPDQNGWQASAHAGMVVLGLFGTWESAPLLWRQKLGHLTGKECWVWLGKSIDLGIGAETQSAIDFTFALSVPGTVSTFTKTHMHKKRGERLLQQLEGHLKQLIHPGILLRTPFHLMYLATLEERPEVRLSHLFSTC